MPPETLKDPLRQAFEHPTDRGVEGPYQYQWDATSEPWKRLCQQFLGRADFKNPYWLTKWMEFDSFRDHEQKNSTPTWATEFEMSAVIEDDTQTTNLDW